MGVLRREKRRAPTAFVASARRIDTSNRSQVEAIRKRREEWQKLCWDYYDEIGEVKYALGTFLGNSMARMLLFAAEFDDEGKPVRTEQAAAIDAVDRLRSDVAGHAELLRLGAINFSVAGECYLVGFNATAEREESWDIRSLEEVEITAEKTIKVAAEAGSDEKVELTTDDTLVRLWLRHPRGAGRADSPLRGVMDACEELLWLSRVAKAVQKSRLAGAGLLYLANELTAGPDDETADESADPESDPMFAKIVEGMTTPIADEESAAAVVPIVLRGEGEVGEKIKHFSFERTLDPEMDKRTDRALQRLAQGINVPPEIVKGVADLNHWSAWQVDEQTTRVHIEPLAQLFCDSLTSAYFRPALKKTSSLDPMRFRVWYDPTDLVAKPDRTDVAQDAHMLGIISDKAARRDMGYGEEDKPSDEEIARRGRQDPPEDESTEGGPPEEEREEPEEPQTASITAAASLQDTGRKALDIDRVLKARLEGAIDDAMRVALDKAGARLASRARKNTQAKSIAASVPKHEVAASLGRTLVASLGVSDEDLMQGAFDSLHPRFDAWVSQSQRQALGLVPNLSESEREEARRQQDEHRDLSWTWLAGALATLLAARLYDPNPSAPEMGEFDSSMTVPFSIVRQAVARAGGATALEVVGEMPLIDGGSRPAGGIGTGKLIEGLFGQQGMAVEAYQWVYGVYPRTRPFEPHMELDGVVFTNFDDPVLVNTSSWPPTSHYGPGDHSGCFPAGTLVQAPLAGASTERWYEGDLVHITTAGGDKLSATPNHPILTGRGWVPAGELDESDQVVRSLSAQGITALVDPHDRQRPTVIEEVARALGEASGMVSPRVPTAAEDFHGDGEGSEVHVVRTNGLLWDDRHAALLQHLAQAPLGVRDEVAALLADARRSLQRLGRVGLAALRRMSGLDAPQLLLAGGGVLGELGRFTDAPDRSARSYEALADRSPVDTEAMAQRFLRLASLVGRGDLLDGKVQRAMGSDPLSGQRPGLLTGAPDADALEVFAQSGMGRVEATSDALARLSRYVSLDGVRKVRRSDFAGHVFNLHTATNWYMANGLIVHNCACDWMQIFTRVERRAA